MTTRTRKATPPKKTAVTKQAPNATAARDRKAAEAARLEQEFMSVGLKCMEQRRVVLAAALCTVYADAIEKVKS